MTNKTKASNKNLIRELVDCFEEGYEEEEFTLEYCGQHPFSVLRPGLSAIKEWKEAMTTMRDDEKCQVVKTPYGHDVLFIVPEKDEQEK